MDLGVFGIVDVGLFGDMVVDGRFGRLGHNLLTFFKMLESMKDLGRDREYDRLMKYFVAESETCVGARDV